VSIPRLTALIGETALENDKNELSSLIKNVRKKVKDDEIPYIVFLVIDLEKEEIYFEIGKKLSKDTVSEYYYFGNNSGAGSQYYLVRESDSIGYLLTSTLSDLYQVLLKNNLGSGELARLIKDMEKKGLIFLGKKKGEGRVNLNKFSLVKCKEVERIELDDKNIKVGEKRYNSENFIRFFINDKNKTNRFVLVVPKVINENGREVIPSTHEEYLEVVKKENKLGLNQKTKKTRHNRVCYICKKLKPDVSSSYSKNFSRTGINKIFTTTTINTSPFLQKFNYDNVYSICSSCYQKLLSGENVIAKEFSCKIAGEDAFIIPQGLTSDFEYKYLGILKKGVDLAFRNSDAKTWIKTIESEQYLSNIKQYLINFIIFRTDGTSVKVLETIEDVPTIRLEKVMKTLASINSELKPYSDNFSLGSIYGLVPVKVNKNGEQVDIGRVLSLYKALLSGEKISYKTLFDYAIEGLEKGLKQFSKQQIDNYYNMGLTRYIGREDFFVKRLIFGYIVLIKTCQELNILDSEVFKYFKREVGALDNIKTQQSEKRLLIEEMEEFLEKQGFDDNAKALFYLGVLIYRVAYKQVKKGHKTKPILSKIQFQGMNKSEITNLYNDVVEKLIQYDELKSASTEKVNTFSEYILNRFNNYYKLDEPKEARNGQENVFYIMSGYSFMVRGKGADPVTTEESQLEIGNN